MRPPLGNAPLPTPAGAFADGCPAQVDTTGVMLVDNQAVSTALHRRLLGVARPCHSSCMRGCWQLLPVLAAAGLGPRPLAGKPPSRPFPGPPPLADPNARSVNYNLPFQDMAAPVAGEFRGASPSRQRAMPAFLASRRLGPPCA